MDLDLFSCPECRATLRRSPALRVGSPVQCPKCAHRFPVPPEDEAPPPEWSPPPDALDRLEPPPPDRDEDRREDPDLDRAATRRAEDSPGPGWPGGEIDLPPRPEEDEDYPITRRDYAAEPSSDYRIDLGEWFTHAKQHYSTILGQAVGFLVIYGVILIGLGLLQQVAMMTYIAARGGLFPGQPGGGAGAFGLPPEELLLVQAAQLVVNALFEVLIEAPLLAGLTAVCLAQLKGARWSFGDFFFSGFRRFSSIAGLALVNHALAVPSQIAQLTGSYFQQQAFAAGKFGNQPEVLVCQLVALLWLLVYGVLWLKLMFFAYQLVFDRGYGPIQAMSVSWKMSNNHFWALVGMGLLLGLINAGGAMACCVGLLFSMPFVSLAFCAGYLLSGGTRPPVPLGYDEDHGYGPRYRGRDDYRPDDDRRDDDRFRRDDY
jgi:hypothetical protein